MLAQLTAINFPARARSLVSIISTTGNWRVGTPRPKMIPLVLRRPRSDREGYVEDLVSTLRAIGSATARAIPAARLLVLEGMAHYLPQPRWPQIVDAIQLNVAATAG